MSRKGISHRFTRPAVYALPADCKSLRLYIQGIPISSRAQAIQDEHYTEFDYLLGMDKNNVRNLISYQPKGSKAQSESCP